MYDSILVATYKIKTVMCLQFQEINILVSTYFNQASDDVKLRLILECLPKLSVKKILSDMSDSEKEVTTEFDLQGDPKYVFCI